jgi:hypothetical protein
MHHMSLFLKAHTSFRLGRKLAICPMTIGQGSDAWNTQLISECLLGNGGYTYLNHFLQRPYTIFTRIVARQYGTLLRPGRKPIHVHIMNRTCPYVVCAIVICIRANPSWSILNSRLVGDKMAVTQKIFIVEFGQESRFLFRHTRAMTICHPSKGEFII